MNRFKNVFIKNDLVINYKIESEEDWEILDYGVSLMGLVKLQSYLNFSKSPFYPCIVGIEKGIISIIPNNIKVNHIDFKPNKEKTLFVVLATLLSLEKGDILEIKHPNTDIDFLEFVSFQYDISLDDFILKTKDLKRSSVYYTMNTSSINLLNIKKSKRNENR